MNDQPTAAVLMPEGYYPDPADQPDDQLDEFLCEYVDGTMDPAVRAAFEEFLEANPPLAAHARCLCRTRTMLCSYGGRHRRVSMESQIRARVMADLDRSCRRESIVLSRLGALAMATSVASIVFILGMLIPFTTMDTRQTMVRAALEPQPNAILPSDAPHDAIGSLLAGYPEDSASHWMATGPSTVLPAIDMSPIGFRSASTKPVRWSALQLASAP